MSQSDLQKDWCGNCKVKVTMRVYLIKIWLFPLYLQNCWLFCNQTNSLVGCYDKPEDLVRKSDCCVQGQGDSEGSKCQPMFGWYLLNHWTFCDQTWCGDASSWARISMRKDWYANFKVKVRARACISKCDQTWCGDASSWAGVSCKKNCVLTQPNRVCVIPGFVMTCIIKIMTVSRISSEWLILLQPEVVFWYIIISQSVLWENWMAFKVKVVAKVQSFNFCPDDIFWTAEPCVTKLGTVMHHRGQERHVKDGFAVFMVKFTMRAHTIKYVSFYHIYWTSHSFATRFNWLVHHDTLKCLVQKLDCCGQSQGHSEVSKLHWIIVSSIFLYSWYLCNQTRCVDVLLLKTKPSAN